MSDKNDYTASTELAKALPENEVKQFRIPVGAYLQEAEDLHYQAASDKKALTAAGLPLAAIDKIAVYAGACRHAQSVWMEEADTRKAAEKEWLLKGPEAFEFRDDLVDNFAFAFRKDSSLLSRVDTIKEGCNILK